MMLRGFMCLMLLFATACNATIDASSNTALVASVAHMKLRLNKKERQRFNDAFITVAFNDLHDADLLDLVKHVEDIVPDAKASIDGKTAQQIMAQAAHIKKQRAAASKR